MTQEEEERGRNVHQEKDDASEGEEAAPPRVKKKLSALGQLFEDEDQALLQMSVLPH